MRSNTKKPWESKTVWAALITLTSVVVMALGGTEVTGEEQTAVVTSTMQIVASITAVLGTIMAVVGRIVAKKQIG